VEISFRLTPLFASSPHAAMRRRGSKNYKNDVLIDIVAKFLNRGMYLICYNGYLCWPTTICPFKRADSATAQEFFTTNLESVRKDVECTFGILKKRWRILNSGFFYRDVKICEKIFLTCCWLNIFLLDLMDCQNVLVGRGAPLRDDGLWLLCPRDVGRDDNITDRILSEEFVHHRSQLVDHLHHFCRKGPIEGALRTR
jgi:hypothetical protein